MTDWPQYESHKIVRAAKIVRVEETERDSGRRSVRAIWVRAGGDAPEEQFEPTVPGMAEKAEVGGWAMLYPDGFKSISPRLAFETGYTLKSRNEKDKTGP